ncbi:hypothetical protein [Lewinella sp. LCG006]|uniref:hypothetical protein n=1 Tax=Lewinella sp. LCG006 TaxID=3231911 RepID=UPI003461317C
MKTLSFICCLLTSLLLQAQSTIAIPRFLIGVEANTHFEDLKYRKNNLGLIGIGLHVEKPIGQFSVGTALIRQRFGPQTFRKFAGEIVPEAPNAPSFYAYWYQEKQLAFWNIPLRLQYRLPCNCVYVQAALQTSIRDLKEIEGEIANWNTSIYPPGTGLSRHALYNVNKISLGYEFAMGINFHLSTTWKMYSRLAYTHYGYFKGNTEQYRNLGDAFLGLNIGLQRAIY